ncbi:MAG: prepilin-type N-terminal cleavage/methylation domain-containing protein, partial [Dokdonella sp.]|nr:prepilin-type N-terminal cleavage/methylation domain-containing protein [Dokdonella sp.]
MRSGRVRGFTLIELMITVAIIAIIVAIAVPSYQDSVRKSRRGQVKADITELAQR